MQDAHDAGAAAPPTAGHWFIQTLGGLRARNGAIDIAHWPSRAIAALLARLALQPDRDHGREELAELLWPGAEPARARNRLRHALSTLRALLDTPALPGTVVLSADRRCVRLNGSVVRCDAVEFERHLRRREHEAARALDAGELLPGFYDDWIAEERHRFVALRERLPDASAPVAPAPAPAGAGAPPQRQVPRLPAAFVGRDDELARLAAALARARLVTVTGPAGCGKSRLALEFAARTQGFDTVCWVPLISCAAPAMVLEHVRAALGLDAGPAQPMEQIAARLAGRTALLVLDNLEHLMAGPRAPFVAELLQRVGGLHVLATSQRAPAHAGGERFVLRPLAPPEADADLPAARRNAAVQLFTQRARARRGDFGVHAGNLRDVVALCRRLDGLPLALELAAARVRKVPLAAMGEALGAPAGAGRHASMANAVAWTWGLLGTAQRRTLAALGVFRGDFDAAAAAAVAGLGGARAAAHLAELEDMSLLQRRPRDGGAAAWGLLSVVRDVAHGRGDAAQTGLARRRHRAWFLARAGALAASFRPADPAELPDLLQAIDSALADGDAATAAAIALALRTQWVRHGAPPLALALLARTADTPAAGATARCALLALLAPLLLDAGRTDEAFATAERAIRLAETTSVHAAVAAHGAWVQVSWRSRRDGDAVLPVALVLLQQARELGDADLTGRACMTLGAITWAHLQAPAAARELFAEAERCFAAHGDPRAALTALPGHTACLLLEGRVREAAALVDLGLEQARRFGDVQAELLLLNRATEAHARLRRHARSADAGRQLVRLAHAHALDYHLAYGLWNLCLPLARGRRPEPAALLMAFSHRYWVDHFGAVAPEDEAYVAKVRAAVQRQLGAAAWAALWARGHALPRAGALALVEAI